MRFEGCALFDVRVASEVGVDLRDAQACLVRPESRCLSRPSPFLGLCDMMWVVYNDGVPSATIDCGLEYGLYAMDDDERQDSMSGSDSSQARKVRIPAARRAARARADESSLARTGEADVAGR